MEMQFVPRDPEWVAFEERLRCFYDPTSRAQSTIRKAMRAMACLEMFAERPSSVDEVTISKIKRYLLEVRNCSKVTVFTMLAAIKAITRIMKKKGVIATCPFDIGDMMPRLPRNAMARKGAHFSIEQIAMVLAKADEEFESAKTFHRKWDAGRTMALVWLAAHSGARAMEIQCARRCRYDGEFLHISHEDSPEGKHKTESSDRWVFVPVGAQRRINEWIAISSPSEWLFPTNRGNGPWMSGGAKCRPAGKVAELGRQVGVNGMTLLSLRHSFMTHARGKWGFARDQVELIAGHSDPNTQDHYVHVDRSNVRDLMARVSFEVPGSDGSSMVDGSAVDASLRRHQGGCSSVDANERGSRDNQHPSSRRSHSHYGDQGWPQQREDQARL